MKLDSRVQFEEAYGQYASPIYRYLYWQTRDAMVAQDLTSASFERAWRSRAQFGGGSAQAWLYRIARNLLIDHWRKKKELLMDDLAGIADQASDARGYDYDKEQELWELGKALDGLDEIHKAVVVLRFIEELSAKEVAAILETTEGNVRVMQFRALRQMRKVINHES